MILMREMIRLVWKVNIQEHHTSFWKVLKLLFDFKFLCNWGLFCDSVNILKFSCSAPKKPRQENIPQGIPLLSEVKFYFWEISHLPNVSTCIKNENLKISQNNLVFCQLDLLFGKRAYRIHTPMHPMPVYCMHQINHHRPSFLFTK